MAHSYYGSEEVSRPWYSKKRVWTAVAVILLIVIVVPVAVTVSKEKQKENRYPNYSKLNYTLLETYAGETFFDKFTYFTGYDPANGHVHYVPRETAAQYNLTYASNTNTSVLKVDTTVGPGSNPDASTGRFSVRVESTNQYEVNTLFVFSILHTPYGCGTWPALWLSDPRSDVWPANGEIDVFEATNLGNTGNQASLHTTKNCDMSGVKRKMTGTAGNLDCYNGTENTGCGVGGGVSTFGEKFNDGGGGVMAVEWREEGIRMWMFGNGETLPAGLGNETTETMPDPSAWGEAWADFPGTDCDIDAHFRNQSIIANIDLCGDLTEAKWDTSGCGSSTCVDYVSDNPDAFVDAYWEFESFKIYKAQ
ncbi:hypothetical protein DL546_001589 [Coniochaeta pulveracea]|uniref:GH16 domain-containing protein n=1 Tax=Coniochaeta pulveracea TaxID=177199 RepID=A0A420XWN9_9PEZI|nr:hypothetical protein DL546_001589 [Coniochaeta pulveracea]